MPIIQKPLLAGKFDPNKAKFPYIATPKVDGIRFTMVNGVAMSRKFKPRGQGIAPPPCFPRVPRPFRHLIPIMKNTEAKKLIPVKVQFEYVAMAYAKDGQSAEAEVRSNLSQVQEDMASFGCAPIVTPLDAVDKQTFKHHQYTRDWEDCIPWGEEDSRTCSKILEDMEEENLKANLTKEQIDKILNQLSAEEVKFMLQN